MKTFAILFFLATGTSAYADTQTVITIKSNFPEGYTGALDLHLDQDGSIQGARYREGNSWGMDYTLHDLHQGLDLVEIDQVGIKVITLTGKSVDAKNGGPIQVKFRRKLLTGDDRILRFQLRPLKNKTASRAFSITSDDVAPALRSTPIDGLTINMRKVFGVPTVVGSMILSSRGKTLQSIDTSRLPNFFYFW